MVILPKPSLSPYRYLFLLFLILKLCEKNSFRDSAHFHFPFHTEFVFHDFGVFVGSIGEDSDSDFFQTCLIRGRFSEERWYADLNMDFFVGFGFFFPL